MSDQQFCRLADCGCASRSPDRHFLGLVSEQHKYSLTCRLPELEVLPASQQLGLGVIPWSPLDGGLLGRNALKKIEGSRSGGNAERVEKHRSRLEQFASLCQELGEPQDNVALAWVLRTRRLRDRLSDRARWSNSKAPCARLRLNSMNP